MNCVKLNIDKTMHEDQIRLELYITSLNNKSYESDYFAFGICNFLVVGDKAVSDNIGAGVYFR